MIPTPKMLISAGIVGVIVVGGLTVAGAAADGRLEIEQQRLLKTVEGKGVSATPTPEPVPSNVVVRELETDPEAVSEYWTPENLEQAEPMPIPRVEVTLN
ncbi:hypothetical protein [Herbidospora mongoliensis]|uniref:hypothetical protein n=1 Tax=Herbidospora mongoliensis TaxID=688067 RepID=UPI00083578DE|nr:hypothetical protein [Herbidospora mongoliensis]